MAAGDNATGDGPAAEKSGNSHFPFVLGLYALLFAAVPNAAVPGVFGSDIFDRNKLVLLQVCAIIGACIFLFRVLEGRASLRRGGAPWGLFFALCLFAGVRAFFMPDALVGLRETARLFSLWLFGWIAFQCFREKHLRILMYAMLIGGVAASLVVLLQFFEIYFGYVVRYSARYAGFFGDPNCLCGHLIFPFWAGVYLFMKRTHRIEALALPVLMAAILAGITLTYSRSGWICFACSLAVFVVLVFAYMPERRKGVIILCTVVLGLMIAAGSIAGKKYYTIDLGTRVRSMGRFLDQEAEGRLSLWKAAAHIGATHAAAGAGPGSFYHEQVAAQKELQAAGRVKRIYVRAYQAYNDYLQLYAELGVPGLLMYVGWLVFLVWRLLQGVRTRGKNSLFSLVALAAVASLVVGHTAFQFPFYNTMLMACAMVFAALGAGGDEGRKCHPARGARGTVARLSLAALAFLFGLYCVAMFPASLRYQKAFALYRMRRFDEAADGFRASLKLYPENYLAHYYAGVALMNVQDYDGAGDHLRRAALYFPTLDMVWLRLAVLDEKRRDPESYYRHIEKYKKFKVDVHTEM